MNEPKTAAPGRANRPPGAGRAHWGLSGHETHLDPLLECLAALTRIHGNPWTPDALTAGLPLVDNMLPPSQLARAAKRANLAVKLVKRPLDEVAFKLLPAILLLENRGACLLLEKLSNDRYRVRFPESGDSAEIVSGKLLKTLYTGIVAYVRPLFRFEAHTPEVGSAHQKHWFWGVVLENWRLYRDTLVAALVLNLFALTTPLFSMNVYDRVVPNRAEETLWVLAIGAMLVLGFDFVLRTIRAYIVDTASKRIDIQLSARIMERVLGMRMEGRPASVGSFASNLRSFESIRDFIASATVTALVDLPFVLVFLLVMSWISPLLLIPTIIGILVILAIGFLTQAKMQSLTESTYRASAQRNAVLVESLSGIEAIKALGAESNIQRQYERATLFIAQIGGRLKLLSSSTVNMTQAVTQAVNIGVIITGVYLLIDAQLTMGAIVAASLLSGRALAPLGQVVGLLMQYHNAKTSLASIEEHMKRPVERPENAPFVHRNHFRGDIEFKEVSFAYPNIDEPAIRNMSFKIKAGEKVGFIGRIGSGKTTLEKLILGFYQPQEGSVLIDGIDLRQIDPADLRRTIGFVPQDITLFYGTLRQNLMMGSPFVDDDQILAAASLAGVTDFANAHPHGFDMLIGERGESLSGGQRQAVAIARALINDPAILVFDEPTSSMDNQSEARLKKNLRQYCEHKTLLLVTHRTSMLELVDRLIVIDHGKIMADGPKAVVIEALQQGRVGKAG